MCPQGPTVNWKLTNEHLCPALTREFSLTELQKALKSANNSAPGIDNIHYAMLSNLSMRSKKFLLALYNKIWEGCLPIPEASKISKVTLILKPNKDPSVPTTYRPIAHTWCVLKTYERMIKHRLQWWLERKKLISESQFGFRKRLLFRMLKQT